MPESFELASSVQVPLPLEGPAPSLLVFPVNPLVPGALDAIWPHIRKELERAVAVDRENYTVEHVYDWVRSSEHQLWVVARDRKVIAVLLTRILPCPSGKRIAELYLCAGADVRQWYRRALEVMESFARLHGCVELRVTGRKGSQRYLARYGYRPAAVILTKSALPPHLVR